MDAEIRRALAHRVQLHFSFAEDCPRFHADAGYLQKLYETPWEEEGDQHWFCSEECTAAYLLLYEECGSCERVIRDVHPRSLRQSQFRDHVRYGGMCLQCYEGEILTNGQPREDFEGDTIRGGMFFSWCNPEPRQARFSPVDGFADYYVSDRLVVRLYNSRARRLIDTEHHVVTGYERLSILGDEGYVTMFSRPGGERA